MSRYSVMINNITVELVDYNVALMEAMENLGHELEATTSVKDKLKKKYDFIVKVSNKEVVIDTLGKFEEADPNDISITFDRIVGTYDKPYNEHTMKEHMADIDIFNSDGINALTKLTDSVSKMENLTKANVNSRYAKRYF